MWFKILAYVIAAVLLVMVIVLFNQHCQERFKFRFFSKRMFFLLGLSLSLWIAGVAVRVQGGDEADLPGYLLIGASCVVFWWVLYLNFTKTTLFYGVIGTAGQLSVFSVFAIAGIFSAILFVGIVFAIMSLFEPVYVVNRNGCRKA